MAQRDVSRLQILAVAAAIAVGGIVAGTPIFGIQLGALAGVASLGAAGPELAGAITNLSGLGGVWSELTILLGEYIPAMAGVHDALPVIVGGGFGLAAGRYTDG